MTWTKPDFVEISLCMEVTAYVNTDASVVGGPSLAAGETADGSEVLAECGHSVS